MLENKSLVEEASTYLKSSKHMLDEGFNLISIFSDSPMSLLLLLQVQKEYRRPKTGQNEK